MLEIKGLKKAFGSLEVLKGVDLKVKQGDVVAILGPSGSGKTTMLRCVNFLEHADGGSLIFDGKEYPFHNISKKDIAAIRQKTAFVFQNYNLFLNKTALHNVTEGLIIGRKMPKTRAEEKARAALEKVGMLDRADYYPHQLSGGMKQRVGIAQALLNNPGILILDEPTAGLDPKERVRFRNLISSLAENRIVILSTHIVSDVEYIANEILIMKNGELIQHGSPEKLLKPIEKCVWECDVSRKEAEELELNYVTANLKHNNGAERLRIISQEAPCRTAWNVDPTLEDLYLYYFAEVSEHE